MPDCDHLCAVLGPGLCVSNAWTSRAGIEVGEENMPGRVLLLRFQTSLNSEIPFGTSAGILLLWFMSFLDYYFTVYEIANGAVELNPFLAPFFNNHQYLEALTVKLILTFPGICALSFFYKRPVVRFALFVVLVVYTILLVYHILNLIM